jgi:hypothetical protein
MIYEEYLAKHNNRQMKVGLLGEFHYYREQELQLANRVFGEYTTIGLERSEKPNLFEFAFIGLPSWPIGAIYKRINKRQVKETSKPEYLLNRDPKKCYVALEKFWRLPLQSYLTIPVIKYLTSPFLLIEQQSSKEAEIRVSCLEKNSPFLNFCFAADERSDYMSERALGHINCHFPRDFLINCGIKHMGRIRKNLSERLDSFELVDKVVVV